MQAPDRAHEAVVRAERFEVVDASGRVLAVVGTLGRQGDGRPIVGVELLDRDGAARAWLAFEEGWGSQLCLAQGGNQVVLVDLVEPGPEAAEPGPAVRLCDERGAPVVEWRVLGGRFVQRLHHAGRPPPA